MKFDWITLAMANDGKITASMMDKFGVKAEMTWPNGEKISGSYCDTLPEAITSLNEALLEDASSEMRESGVV